MMNVKCGNNIYQVCATRYDKESNITYFLLYIRTSDYNEELYFCDTKSWEWVDSNRCAPYCNE